MDISSIARHCPQCGTVFHPYTGKRGKPASFCAPSCRQAFVTTDRQRGEQIVALAQAWRAGKKGQSDNSRYALKALCAALDAFNAEDRARNRRPELIVAAKRRVDWSVKDRH